MGITAMRHNRAGYYIREGINSIFTHGFMSFASICIIIACLLIMGSFALIALNVDEIIDTMESENVILAFVDESLSESEARALQSEIEAVPNVDHAEFATREESWESFVNSYDDTTMFEGLDSSVLRHRFVVYLVDIALTAETQTALTKIPGIADVNAHLEISDGFVRLSRVVTIVSLVLVAILFIISLFIMSNTVKLTTFERRDEIAIMKMVGATSGFIRWPFVVEGLILGLVGSLLAFILQWGVYDLVINRFVGSSGIAFLTFMPFGDVAVPLLIAFGVVGLGVGVIGSLIAIKNYLKV